MSRLRDHLRPHDQALPPDATLRDALDTMVRTGNRHVFLVEDDTPVGVLTERDVLRMYAEGVDFTAPCGARGRRPVVHADESRPVRYALSLMVDNGIRRVAVVDADGRWRGSVCHEDLLYAYEAELAPAALTVRELASGATRALTLPPEASLGQALDTMRARNRGSLILTDEDELLGILTESDIIRIARDEVSRDQPLSSVTRSPVRTVAPDTDLRALISFMREGRMRHAVARMNGDDLHIITSRDVLNNLTGSYGSFLELRLRDLRATLDDLDTPVVEIARLGDTDVVSWRNEAARRLLDIGLDAPASELFGAGPWAELGGQLDSQDRTTLPSLHRGGRAFKVSLSSQIIGDMPVIKAIFTDISELASVASRLRERVETSAAAHELAHALFFDIFELAPNGMALATPDGRIRLVNENLARMHGVPPAALVGRRIDELVVAEQREAAMHAWQSLWSAGAPDQVEMEVQLWTADGTPRWAHAMASRTAAPRDGEPYAICAVTDTQKTHAALERLEEARTEQAALTAALKEREAHTAAILNQAAAAIVTVGEDGRLLDPNPACCTFLGLSREQLHTRTPFDIIHPAEHARARDQHVALLEGDMVSLAVERRYLHADGRVLWGRTALTRIADEQGRSRGLVAVIHDITEHKSTERQTRELAELLDRNVNEVYVIEPEGHRIVYANRSAQAGLGMSLSQLQATTPFTFTRFPERAFRQRIESLLDGPEGPSAFLQAEHRRSDGSRYPVQIHLSRVEFSGRPHVLGVVVDATEEVRAQRALMQQNLHFESAQRIAGVGSWELDATSGNLTWSAEMYRIFREHPHRFRPTRDRFTALFPAPAAARIDRAIATALETGVAFDLRLGLHLGTEQREVRLHGEPTVDATDRTQGIVGSCLDITKLGRIERELRERTRWLEEAQRIAQVGSWQWDAAEDRLRWSPETYRLYGVDPETFTPSNQSFYRLLSPQTRREVSAHLDDAIASGDRIDFRHEMVVHGETRIMHQTGRIVRDDAGTVLHHVGTVNDITAEVRAAEALSRQARHLENAQRVGGVGSFEWDPLTNRNHWSPQTYAIAGRDPDAPPYTPEEHLTHIHPDDRAAFEAAVGACIEQGQSEVEYRLLVDGAYRLVHSIGRMVEQTDAPPYMVGTLQDITEQRERARVLQAQKRKLEHAQRIAHVGSWEWEPQSGRVAWSDETFRIFGRDITVGPPDTETFQRLIHGEGQGDLAHALAVAKATDGIYEREHEIVVGDEIRVVHEHGEIEVDAMGALVRVHGTSHDITDHKRAEARLSQALMDTIQTISRTFAKRDPYTAAHQRRVADLAVAVGRRMGMTGHELESLRLGALIHDIGKISVPAELLAIPRRLTAVEYTLIQTHSEQGWEILRGVDLPWPLGDMARHHHERLDGSGYPHGLKGDEISPLVRIISVADVTEAMASHRPYRPGLGVPVALDELRSGHGTIYDPDVVDHTLRLFGEDGYTLPSQ